MGAFGGRLQRRGHRFIDHFQPDKLHVGAHLLRDFLEILAVACRQHYPFDAGAGRGHHLLLDTTDRQHQPPETDLAGHGSVAAHGPVRHQGHECHEHGDAGTWAVFGNSTSGHVHVNVGFFKSRRIDAEIAGPILYDAERGLGTLPHDFAKLTGENQSPAARCTRRLDKEDVAPNRRPGKAGGDAGDACAHGQLAFELGRSEHDCETIAVDPNGPALAFRDAYGRVTQGLTHLAFEIAHTCLARIALNDLPQSRIGNFDLLRLEAVGLKLAAYKIATRDLELFAGYVAGERNHLHTVA